MDRIKQYLIKNFEHVFVLLILVSVTSIVYYIPYKQAFLNFYYIPVLLAAYYLGSRTAVLGAMLTVIVVGVMAWIFPESFRFGASQLDLVAELMTWACFLILAAAIVGRLNYRLKQQMLMGEALNAELSDNKNQLEKSNQELIEHTEHLEQKVLDRTDLLNKSKQAVEHHKKQVEEALYSTMDPTVVKLLIEKRLRTEKRRISILFCDLQGFTNYSEDRHPEAVITDLNRYLSEMEETLLQYNAHIDKYMGDGIMAEFGAPIDYARHGLMAVVAGLIMQRRVLEGGHPWLMRVGIATGEPIMGLIGNKRQSYTALGDAVNLASRIEELCNPGKVTVDEETYKEIKQFVRCRIRSAHGLHHKNNPELALQLDEQLMQLETAPCDASILKKIAHTFRQLELLDEAHDYLRKAIEQTPNDQELKLAYAEVSLQLEQREETEIRGRRQSIHIYEVEEIIDPLMQTDKIPRNLYERYWPEVKALLDYPEAILLPAECLEGSIGHSKVVGFLSYIIADQMALPAQEKLEILEAGYLSDVGKSIIPHHVLNRRGSLSKEEFADVEKHPQESIRRLKRLGYESEHVFELIAAHHANFNGGGYPADLSGEQIPIGSRIIAVAEAYDSLTAWRPYRERWESTAAFYELQQNTMTGKFDPQVVEVLGKVLGLRPAKESLLTIVGR